jgi:hypothetical protein
MAETARRFDVFRFFDSLDSRLQGAVTVGARERFAPIEDWHIVGGPDEPRFRSYPASVFTNPDLRGPIFYDHGASPVSFFRDTSGVVHLRGELVRSEHGNIYNPFQYPAFALPPGYREVGGQASSFTVAGSRPTKSVDPRGQFQQDHPVVTIGQAGSSPAARGLVTFYEGLPPGASVFLDGIRFLAAPVNRERYITDGDRPPPGY